MIVFDSDLALAEINNEISFLRFDRKPKELYEPITYFLNLGGKRIRPLLAMFCCYLYGGNNNKSLKPSLALELFHNFSLIHDDIMDKAPLRRGQPTIHEKYDSSTAILVGDVTLIEAYDLLGYIEDSIRFELFTKFNLTARQVCEGQQLDMIYEKIDFISINEYLEMIILKTAVLFGFSMYMGARIGGASIPESEKLYTIGKNIGIAFQIKDDYLDVFGNQKNIGKVTGGDIIAGKKTFLLVSAYEHADTDLKAGLTTLIKDKQLSNEDKIDGVLAIYNLLYIQNKTQIIIESYFNSALDILNQLDISSDKKEDLKNYFIALMKRIG